MQPRAVAYHEQEQRNQHHILEHAAERSELLPSFREVNKKLLNSPDDKSLKHPDTEAIKQGTDSGQGSQEICRRVPSRQNRCKRAGTFHSSSVAASPMNAFHDILYLQTPLSAYPTEMEFEMSGEVMVTSQNQAAIQVICLNSNCSLNI